MREILLDRQIDRERDSREREIQEIRERERDLRERERERDSRERDREIQERERESDLQTPFSASH